MYKCLRCNCIYFSVPGPTHCPKCRHLYVKWLNYDSLRKGWLLSSPEYRKHCS